MSTLDRRLNAYRTDLADIALDGLCDATHFVEPDTACCIVSVASIKRAPASDAMQLTQALYGEEVKVFERQGGWAWVQVARDGYVGYVEEAALGPFQRTASHFVATRSTHLYPKPDLKTQPALPVPMNAILAVASVEGDYLALTSGQFVFAEHVRSSPQSDFVSVAEQFLHTPYLWGGKTVWGIDCSGLVQVALHACGRATLRDSDMQEQSLGHTISRQDLQRGDLAFWNGHVGIMQDAENLLHANGHHMKVVSEPLDVAVARIAARGSNITALKRL